MTKQKFLGNWIRQILPDFSRGRFSADLDALLDAARRDEREACIQAVLALQPPEGWQGQAGIDDEREGWQRGLADAAGAIRARGGTDG